MLGARWPREYRNLKNRLHLDVAEEPEDTLDLEAMALTLWRGRWMVVLVTVLFMALGALYAFVLAVPTFRSSVSLILETRTEQVVDFENVVGALRADDAAINTEVEVLRSRSLLGLVVDKLDLVADPEFNGLLRDVPLSRQVSETVSSFARTILGIAAEELPPPSEQMIRERIISALAEKITVTNITTSFVFEVAVEAEAPGKAALIANTLADLYVTNQIATKYEATEQATLWLAGRVNELQAELNAAEEELKDFRTTAKVTDADTLAEADSQLAGLRDRLRDQENKATGTATRLAALEAADTPEERLAAANDPVLRGIAEAPAPGGDEAVKTASLDRRFAELLVTARQEAERDSLQLESLRVSLASLEETVRLQTADLIRLDELTRGAEQVRLVYEYFLGRLRETSVQQGLQRADSRVLAPAVPPERAAAPQKSRILAIATVLGLMLGIAIVFLRGTRIRVAMTAAELEAATGRSVAGIIPMLKGRRLRDMLGNLAQTPASFSAELIRNLRTSLILRGAVDGTRVIVVTSALPGEGKSVLSGLLAKSFADLGRRVLIVDADLRRRTLTQEVLDTPPRFGLRAMAAGQGWNELAVIEEPVLGAHFVPAEATRGSAADILASENFRHFLTEARRRYDCVIIDAPPLLILPDARLVAKLADTVVLGVRWNHTHLNQVRAALKLLVRDGVDRVSGLVLTVANPKAIARYGDTEGYFGIRTINSYFRE